MFGERALHTRRKGLQNMVEERVEAKRLSCTKEKIYWQYILKCELLIKGRTKNTDR